MTTATASERNLVTTATIRFPVDQPLPAALVRKLVKARIAENEARRKRAGKRSTLSSR